MHPFDRFTPNAKLALQIAEQEAKTMQSIYIGTEHLLLGLLREQDGVAAQVLMNLNLRLEDVREEVLNLLGATDETDDMGSVVGGEPIPYATILNSVALAIGRT